MKALLLIILSTLTLNGLRQTKISGIVKTGKGSVIPGANIMLHDTKLFAK